ncbi:amidohydrolase family protein [Sphingomonas sp. PWP1-2]|uniref:amidohydrolase family protein n=1 Tax=Sphingomonas sp. PWP1-2 TaxID=2804558 RepID=UPI003CF7DD04
MIDAHVHVWRIGANGCTWPTAELTAIHRDFDLDDYRAIARGIDGVILVQSQENAIDTDWLLDLAAQDSFVAGVVGWCDLHASNAAERITELSARPKLRGLRPMVQDRAADWYDDPALDAAFAVMTTAGLVLDALVRPQHLPALARLAQRHPDLRIVVDHAGKPDLGALGAWSEALRTLAAFPKTWCKLSGLLNEVVAGQEDARIAEIVAAVQAAFGPDRILWGSDWPVLHLAASHAEWLAKARDLVPVVQHRAVFRETAAFVYGLAA